VGLELDAELFGYLHSIVRRIETNGEDHHVELFLFDSVIEGRVAKGDILGNGVFFDDRDIASEEAHIGEVFCPLVVALEVFAVGADIIMEDGTLRVGVVILSENDLLLGIGTADSRAVAVAPFHGRIELAGTNALDPGDLVGMLQIGGAQDLSLVGTCRGQETLVVHGGDQVLEVAVVVLCSCFGIEGVHAGGEDHGGHIDLDFFGNLSEVDGLVLADRFTDAALLVLEVEAAFVDVGDQGDSLGKVDVDRFVLGDVLVELVRILDRTVFDARGAARALVLVDIAGLLQEGDREVSCRALNVINLGVGEYFYVRVPADLDQLGCEYSH
jgi:hypothetical protein